ncbi:DedA family protein [Corynebacterium amycolatum]|uniref:DedA family protein n=1 Tax=Corynebacterium amycolatum TaxID=43765 RepID=UPI002159CA8C|nr:VTT domain-containing protein [Corynebacterium amycolatum]MDC7115821.1 VTT domain-containing protein [Corynebacterium amycolatum]UVE00811.1 VTT domain-containing protein [Corynebacterium amycolatum]
MDLSGFLSGIGDPEALLQGFGPWVLAGLGLIIFIESGVLFPFLPGDSLLVTAAVLRSELDVHTWQVLVIGIVAAVLGDQVGYFLGHSFGHKLFSDNAKVLRTDRLEAAEKFFAKYGPLSLVLGRFVPIVRTYIPLAAGTANMPYGKFIGWNVAGAIGWVASMVAVGVLLGNIPGITSSIDKIMLLVIAISVLSVVIGGVNARRKAAVAKRSV